MIGNLSLFFQTLNWWKKLCVAIISYEKKKQMTEKTIEQELDFLHWIIPPVVLLTDREGTTRGG